MSFFNAIKKLAGGSKQQSNQGSRNTRQGSRPQQSGKFAYVTAGKQPDRDALGRAIVTAASGSQVELEIKTDYWDESVLCGRPKADGEEFSRTVKLHLLQTTSQKGAQVVEVYLAGGQQVGEVAYKDMELANEIMSAVRNLIISQDPILDSQGFVLEVSAKISGEWSEDEDEGKIVREPSLYEATIRLKNPLELEVN